MCRVSICIPAYNNAVSLQKLIESIDVQTYTDYEVIITDDSSTNDVQDYVTRLGNTKIRYYRNVKQLGATGNYHN